MIVLLFRQVRQLNSDEIELKSNLSSSFVLFFAIPLVGIPKLISPWYFFHTGSMDKFDVKSTAGFVEGWYAIILWILSHPKVFITSLHFWNYSLLLQKLLEPWSSQEFLGVQIILIVIKSKKWKLVHHLLELKSDGLKASSRFVSKLKTESM